MAPTTPLLTLARIGDLLADELQPIHDYIDGMQRKLYSFEENENKALDINES